MCALQDSSTTRIRYTYVEFSSSTGSGFNPNPDLIRIRILATSGVEGECVAGVGLYLYRHIYMCIGTCICM